MLQVLTPIAKGQLLAFKPTMLLFLDNVLPLFATLILLPVQVQATVEPSVHLPELIHIVSDTIALGNPLSPIPISGGVRAGRIGLHPFVQGVAHDRLSIGADTLSSGAHCWGHIHRSHQCHNLWWANISCFV